MAVVTTEHAEVRSPAVAQGAAPPRARPWWLAPLLFAAVWVPLLLALDGTARHVLHLVGGGTLVVVAAVGVRSQRPASPGTWWLLVTANATAVLAALLAFVQTGSIEGPAAFQGPSVASYAAAYGLLVTAYVKLLRRRCGERDPTHTLDALIFSMAIMLVVWVLVLQPTLGAAPVGEPEWWLAVASPTAHLFLAILLFRLLLLRTDGNSTILLLALAMASVVAGDLTRFLSVGTSWSDGLPLAGYLAAFACAAAALLHPHVRWAANPASTRQERVLGWRFWLFVGSAATVPLMYTVQRLRTPSGEGLDVLALLAFLMFALFVARLWVTLGDLNRSRARAAENEALFRSVLDHAPDGVLITDADANIVYASPSCGRLLGHPVDELPALSSLLFMDGEDDLARAERLNNLVLENPRRPISETLRVRHGDGSTRVFEVTSKNLLDEPGVNGVVVNFRDITDQHALQATLVRRAETDDLTGLGNRAALRAHVDELIDRGTLFAVLLFDLDDFKAVNDSFGHDTGDALLVILAQRVQHALRSGDLACRLGGDELAVVLSPLRSPEQAEAITGRLLHAIREPVTIADRSLRPSASAGIVLSTDIDPSVESLLSSVDLALYEAKRSSKNRARRYEARMRDSALARVRLRSDIEYGLEHSAFVCHYQPVVALQTEQILGVEALARWRQPDGRLEAPDAFLPLAEETGLITDLGAEVFRQACDDGARWARHTPLVVSVNVSALQLDDPDFHRQVLAQLEASGLPPHLLLLEVTESALMQAVDRCRDNLHALRAQRVRFAIDDFGTGYSSLGHVRALPVDVLKIDREFVAGVDGGPENSALAKAIMRLASVLELDVAAEGIERQSQATALREMGCPYGQGYLYGRPMPAADLTQLLATAEDPAEVGPDGLPRPRNLIPHPGS